MLQKLNEQTKGVVAWFIIILIAITFTLFGVDSYLQSRGASQVKAVVNGQDISVREYDILYRRLRQQQDPSQLTSGIERQIKAQAFQQLLVNLVTEQAAQNNGFMVAEEQAKQAILQIPQFQDEGSFSPARYQQALSYAMYTPESFLQEVQQGMLINQFRFAFVGTSFVLPSDVARFVGLVDQQRNFDVLTVAAPSFYSEAKVSASDIESYYKKHLSEFMQAEKVSIEYIELSMPQISSSIVVDEQTLKTNYDENLDSYRKPAKWRVAHILFALDKKADEKSQQEVLAKAQNISKQLQKDPQQFSAFVKRYSADKLSAMNEGLMPWITASGTPNAIEMAVLDMKKGGISKPVKTEYGYEILKLEDKQPSTVTPFATVKQSIRKQMVADLAQHEFADKSEQLTDLSYQNPDSLQDVSEQLQLPIHVSKSFDKTGGDTVVTKNKQVIDAAFSHEVLAQGNNSEPVQLGTEALLVLRIKAHTKAAPKPLAALQDTIKQILIKQYAAKRAQDLGTQLFKDINSKKDLKSLMDKNHLKWQSYADITRQSAKPSPGVNQLAFDMNQTDIGRVRGRAMSNGDYVLLKLRAVMLGKVDSLSKEQRQIIEQQMESTQGMMDYDLLITSLMKSAEIQRN